MNPVLWELIFGKKGSLFGFGKGTQPVVFDGMRGFKTYKETFIVKVDNGYITVPKTWNDEDEIYD